MASGGGGEIEETEAEKAQAKVAVARWNDYQEQFKPYEDQFMGEVDDLNSSANIDRAQTMAMSPLAQQFAQEGAQIRSQMQSQGVNPNSGKAKSFNSALTSTQAGAEVDAGSRGVSAQNDRYVGGLQNIVAMGQGQAGEAMQGMTDIAQSAQNNAATKAATDLSNTNNIRSGVGAVVGAGTSYGLNQSSKTTSASSGLWDNQADQTYSANVDPLSRVS